MPFKKNGTKCRIHLTSGFTCLRSHPSQTTWRFCSSTHAPSPPLCGKHNWWALLDDDNVEGTEIITTFRPAETRLFLRHLFIRSLDLPPVQQGVLEHNNLQFPSLHPSCLESILLKKLVPCSFFFFFKERVSFSTKKPRTLTMSIYPEITRDKTGPRTGEIWTKIGEQKTDASHLSVGGLSQSFLMIHVPCLPSAFAKGNLWQINKLHIICFLPAPPNP